MKKIIFKIGLDDANLSWTKVKPVGYDYVFFTLNNRFSGIDENNLFLANHGSLKSKINNLLFILLEKNISNINTYKILILILRIINFRKLKNVKNTKNINFVYSSLCDYDQSDHLSVLVHPFLSKYKWFRAVKETRLEFRYPELFCFKISDAIIFNHNQCFEFFKKKYPLSGFFDDKKIITNLDEEVKPSFIINSVKRKPKFSVLSNKIHITILTGKAFSDLTDVRSGPRQFYVKLIEEMLSLGYYVDMFCFKIINDVKGINRYKKLNEKYPLQFKIKKPLKINYDNDETLDEVINSYSILSQYDYGFIHNYTDGSDVSKFDSINIPHRFHQYQVAGLIPIILKNKNLVLQDIFSNHQCGLVYENLNNLELSNKIKFKPYTPTFEDFLEELVKIYKQL